MVGEGADAIDLNCELGVNQEHNYWKQLFQQFEQKVYFAKIFGVLSDWQCPFVTPRYESEFYPI